MDVVFEPHPIRSLFFFSRPSRELCNMVARTFFEATKQFQTTHLGSTSTRLRGPKIIWLRIVWKRITRSFSPAKKRKAFHWSDWKNKIETTNNLMGIWWQYDELWWNVLNMIWIWNPFMKATILYVMNMIGFFKNTYHCQPQPVSLPHSNPTPSTKIQFQQGS